MTLWQKILIAVALTFACVIVILHVITRLVILGSFARLEEQRLVTNVKRVQDALNEDLSALASTGGDYAAWDETWEFVQNGNHKYVEKNVVDSAIVNLRLNDMIFASSTSQILYGRHVELSDGKGTSVPASLIDHVISHPSLLSHAHSKDSKKGLVLLPEGPVLLVSWPVSKNNFAEPVRGTLVIVRDLNEQQMKRLADRTHLSLRFIRCDAPSVPEDFAAARASLSKDAPIAIRILNPRSIAGYAELPDLYGSPCLLLRVDTPRDIYAQGLVSARYFMIALLTVGALVLIVLLVSIHRMVLGPVSRLTGHVVAIGRTNDLSARLPTRTRDEIGILTREFNDMVGKLADARNKLLEQSYYSGLAQMASGVLHNVRNALSPMVNSLGETRRQLSQAPLDNVRKALEELDGESVPAERKASLARFARLGGERMASLIRETDEALGAVLDQVRQIEEILAEHDRLSRSEKAIEPLSLETVLREATALMTTQRRDTVLIEIDSGMSQLPPVHAERVVLMRVFANLLTNAVESIMRSGRRPGWIRIRGKVEQGDGALMVHAQISDCGEGIAPGSLKRLFERGFTTKERKGSGIGLHWCANAIASMNGRLYAESEGPGLGACFHIMLPAAV